MLSVVFPGVMLVMSCNERPPLPIPKEKSFSTISKLVRKSVPNFESSKSPNACYFFINYSIISLYRQIVFTLPNTEMIHLYFPKRTVIIYEFLSAISVIIDHFVRKLSHFSSQTSTLYPRLNRVFLKTVKGYVF